MSAAPVSVHVKVVLTAQNGTVKVPVTSFIPLSLIKIQDCSPRGGEKNISLSLQYVELFHLIFVSFALCLLLMFPGLLGMPAAQ